uniref:Uncharacterized protein n=1 Tax=Aquila chrysaetos chrysaetos TaxID=223781 RepID=A0A663DZT2_AQUCH
HALARERRAAAPSPHTPASRRQTPTSLRRSPSPHSTARQPPARPALTELAVAVAAPAQPLQVPLQHVGEEVAGRNLHRVPTQRLANLRHRHPQQPPRVGFAHAGSARRGAARARRPPRAGRAEGGSHTARRRCRHLGAAPPYRPRQAAPLHRRAHRAGRGASNARPSAGRRRDDGVVAAAGGLGRGADRHPPHPKKPRKNGGFLQRCEEKLVSGGSGNPLGWASPGARDHRRSLTSAGPKRPSGEQKPGASFKQAAVPRVTRKLKILRRNGLSEALFDYF